MRIAIIGGTGKEGSGLALRWALAGHYVIIGSRDITRAVMHARELRARLGSRLGAGVIEGEGSLEAARHAQVVVLSVPYAAHEATLKELRSVLKEQLVLDITVPLRPPHVSRVHLPAGGSAALEAQAILGPEVPLASSLHHASSGQLADLERPIDGHLLFVSDHAQARAILPGLLADLQATPLDAGPLQNSIALEALTPVLLQLSKTYKGKSIGLGIMGIPATPKD